MIELKSLKTMASVDECDRVQPPSDQGRNRTSGGANNLAYEGPSDSSNGAVNANNSLDQNKRRHERAQSQVVLPTTSLYEKHRSKKHSSPGNLQAPDMSKM